MNTETKVLVFGLDGATLKLLSPWIQEGELPFLEQLATNGVHGSLEVVFPTLSPLEWAGFFTSKNPAKLGLFGAGQIEDPRKTSETKLITSRSIEGPTLWELLNEHGKPVGVMNIPATYPPAPVDGFMISGMMTPPSSDRYYHPRTLKRYLRDYKIGLEAERLGELPDKEIEKQSLLRELYQIHETRVKTIRSLLSDFSVDFFLVNFKEIDELQHLFWEEKEILLDFYKTVDKSMRKIHSLFESTHIIVMSDHGFHQAEKEYFYPNTWLEQEGYLQRTQLGSMYSFFHPFISRIMQGKIREVIPEAFKTREKIASVSGRMINFDKTTAYANMWGVFIPDELKDSAQYENLKEKLKRKLKEAKDPRNGKKIFVNVYEREELYSGKHLHKFPELIFVPKPRYLPNPGLSNQLFEARLDKPYLEGAHKSDRYGILFMEGKGIGKRGELEKANILDLTPTILNLYNIPTPSGMDGSILNEAFIEER